MVETLLPPQNIEAEEAILGGILLDPTAFGRIEGILKPDSFYMKAHQQIYNATATLAAKGEPTDLMVVTGFLMNHKLLEQVGGTQKLAQLVDTVSAINIDRYAILVEEKAQRRRLINAARKISEQAYDGTIELEELLESAEKDILALRQEVQPSSGYWGDITARQFTNLEQAKEDKTIQPVLRTGLLNELDEATNFLPGDLGILLGSSGSCKTSFANQLSMAWAKKGFPIFFWSREMSEGPMWARGTATNTGINSLYLNRRPDLLSDADMDKLICNLEESSFYPIWLHFRDNYVAAFNQAQQRFRELGHGDIKVMLVDHLQLIAGNDPSEIDRWVRELKLFAIDRQVLIVLLAQPCDLSNRNDKRPQIDDISYCKTARQHPDFVFGWYRPNQWNDADSATWHCPIDPDWEVFELQNLKTRHQADDLIRFIGNPATCQFRE